MRGDGAGGQLKAKSQDDSRMTVFPGTRTANTQDDTRMKARMIASVINKKYQLNTKKSEAPKSLSSWLTMWFDPKPM